MRKIGIFVVNIIQFILYMGYYILVFYFLEDIIGMDNVSYIDGINKKSFGIGWLSITIVLLIEVLVILIINFIKKYSNVHIYIYIYQVYLLVVLFLLYGLCTILICIH